MYEDMATRHDKHGEVQSLLLLCGHSGLGSGTLTIELSHWSNTVFYKVVLSADNGQFIALCDDVGLWYREITGPPALMTNLGDRPCSLLQ